MLEMQQCLVCVMNKHGVAVRTRPKQCMSLEPLDPFLPHSAMYGLLDLQLALRGREDKARRSRRRQETEGEVVSPPGGLHSTDCIECLGVIVILTFRLCQIQIDI